MSCRNITIIVWIFASVALAPPDARGEEARAKAKPLLVCTLGRWEYIELIRVPGKNASYALRGGVQVRDNPPNYFPIITFSARDLVSLAETEIRLRSKNATGEVELRARKLDDFFTHGLDAMRHGTDSGDWIVELHGTGPLFTTTRSKVLAVWEKLFGPLENTGIDPLKFHAEKPE